MDEKAADPDDKHMPASVKTAYRCEKDPTGDHNRDSLINCINEIALNTPDAEEKVKIQSVILSSCLSSFHPVSHPVHL